MGYKPPATPYCGFDRDDDNRRVLAESAAHVLVSGPTGRGKTRRILAPAAVLWGGPAVVVSSKDDLFQLVMERRYGSDKMRQFLKYERHADEAFGRKRRHATHRQFVRLMALRDLAVFCAQDHHKHVTPNKKGTRTFF